jgi:hypothetical protein
MKIIVAATKKFHALSRKQLEALIQTLPSEYFKDIQQVSLEIHPKYQGRCEYDSINKRLRLFIVVDEKTIATTENAIKIFLGGIARMQSGATFFERVRQNDSEFDDFVNKWLPLCLNAAA